MYRKLFRLYSEFSQGKIGENDVQRDSIEIISQLEHDTLRKAELIENHEVISGIQKNIKDMMSFILDLNKITKSSEQTPEGKRLKFTLLMHYFRKHVESITSIVNEYDASINKYDLLTGLLTRNYLREWEKLGNKNYILFFLDLDNLKTINDNKGHEKGDQLLRNASSFLKSIVRQGHDTVVRWGGDEFILLVSTDDHDVSNFEISSRIERQIKESEISISIGIAFSSEGETFQKVLEIADNRMYQHKNSKKEQLVSVA